MSDFADRLVTWQRRHGRNDLPWQHPVSPYRVWLSEIMLQQTQVVTVIPYFQRFVARFPDLASLAAASEDDVLALWSGLGYYSRARNLQRTARLVVERHAGELPADQDALAALPGIGRSTAAAIVAQAWNRRAAILDGNVKRVLARHALIAGWPGERAVENRLWQEAERRLPSAGFAAYTQALMDLGALVCVRRDPRCDVCPVAADCGARLTGSSAALPAPRPKKTLPERSAVLLLIADAHGRLLLEKRPASGVWGGLWCPPQLAADADPSGWCINRLGVAPVAGRRLPVVRHLFTHFRLHLTPIELVLAGPAPESVAERAATCWLLPTEALALGLPAPVRSLLARWHGPAPKSAPTGV